MSDEEMINGETVEIRTQLSDSWYQGIVYRASKMWVVELTPLDPEDPTPDPEHVECENTIAEWRRPGSLITYRNPLPSDYIESHAGELRAKGVPVRVGVRLPGQCPACGGGDAYIRVVGQPGARQYGAVCDLCSDVSCRSATPDIVAELWEDHGIID